MAPNTTIEQHMLLKRIRASRRLADEYERNVWLDVRIALDSGVPMERITESLECDRATVYRHLSKHGIKATD